MKKVNELTAKETKQVAAETAFVIQALTREGHRSTLQRLAVLDILIRYSSQYLDGERIYRLVKQGHPNVGIATIYRTLTLLGRLNFLAVISTIDKGNLYRLQLEEHPKYWLICRKCGSITEHSEPAEWMNRLLERNGFLVAEASVYGTCQQCFCKNS